MIDLDERGFIIPDGEMRTSLGEIWVAEDCRSKLGKQIIKAYFQTLSL